MFYYNPVCFRLHQTTLSLMAVDRQDCVLRPFHRRITTRNVKTVILVTWFVALVLNSVYILFEISCKRLCVSKF